MPTRSPSLQACWLTMVLLACFTAPASAEDWMYRRSYYTHNPPQGEQPAYPLSESRSAYRPAYYREAFGLSIRSAYRVNNYIIQNGNRFDRTYYREGYVEINP